MGNPKKVGGPPPIRRTLTSIVACAVILAGGTMADAVEILPRLGADGRAVSVSGLSSGGFMAVQYEVAHSAEIVGAGIIAGGPYNCYVANGDLVPGLALSTCMTGSPKGGKSFATLKTFRVPEEIDPIQGLISHKIYMFSGRDDSLVKQSVMNGLRDFYEAAHIPASNIHYVDSYEAGHAFISPNEPANACDANKSPFVNHCQILGGSAEYDQPREILAQIYGPLKPKANAKSAGPKPFNQAEFAGEKAEMADTGYVYVPAACEHAQGCRIHVVFHGCSQSAGAVGDAIYGIVGYNEWADTNRIIVVFPQIKPSGFNPLNPTGCWDWWGYTGKGYQTKAAPQIAAVHAMIARLTEK